jgi:hypothetical protein
MKIRHWMIGVVFATLTCWTARLLSLSAAYRARVSNESSHDLRKARTQSARAIPVYAALLVLSALLLCLAGRFVVVPVWLTVTVVGLTIFTLVGDVMNVARCEWRLRCGTSNRCDAAEPDRRADCKG